jgi:hypothetical protein
MTGFEEDLPALADRAYALALDLCMGCANYHIYWPARRAAGIVGGSDADRAALVSGVMRIARSFDPAADRTFAILVAGAADTGILAAVVEALFLSGGRELLERASFCVVDRCETPLRLCQEYAGKHAIAVTTERADLSSYSPASPFDLVVVHSVLAFFPQPARAGMLARMGGWLCGSGQILLSANMSDRTRIERDERFEHVILPKIRAAVADGRIVLHEDEAVFLDRCRDRHSGISYDRSGFAGAAQFNVLAQAAGLAVDHVEELNTGGANGSAGSRPRLIAVMSAAGERSPSYAEKRVEQQANQASLGPEIEHGREDECLNEKKRQDDEGDPHGIHSNPGQDG